MRVETEAINRGCFLSHIHHEGQRHVIPAFIHKTWQHHLQYRPNHHYQGDSYDCLAHQYNCWPITKKSQTPKGQQGQQLVHFIAAIRPTYFYFHFQMQWPQSVQFNRSSKQLLVRKMKHAGQIDREIRKNWKNLFRFMNQERMHNPAANPNSPGAEHSPSPSPSPPPHRRILTECADPRIERQNSNPKKLTALHSELKRRKVQERQRKNEEIFFKKHTCDVQSLSKEARRESQGTVGLAKRHSMQLQQRRSMEGTLPFMLRRRTAKLEKEMGIIKHNYKDSLQKIENREQLKCSLNLQDRQELINRIKGSKVYYQFLKEWRSDQQDTI